MNESNERKQHSVDDFDKFIRHADFGKVLELAGILQDQKSRLVTFSNEEQKQQQPRHLGSSSPPPSHSLRPERRRRRSSSESNHTNDLTFQDYHFPTNGERPSSQGGFHNESATTPSQNAADLIRATLIPPDVTSPDHYDPSHNSNGVRTNAVLGRGTCAVTDSLIDETIHSLAEELRLCLDLKSKLLGMDHDAPQEIDFATHRESRKEYANLDDDGHKYYFDASNVTDANREAEKATWKDDVSKIDDDGSDESEGLDEKGDPLITKFSKWQTDLLIDWMIEHREHPFPTHEQIRELAKITDLKETQVVNWTTNVRKRNQKATVEKEKKPHHFLDFLFLASDREKKMRRSTLEMNDVGVGSSPARMDGMAGMSPLSAEKRNNKTLSSLESPYKLRPSREYEYEGNRFVKPLFWENSNVGFSDKTPLIFNHDLLDNVPSGLYATYPQDQSSSGNESYTTKKPATPPFKYHPSAHHGHNNPHPYYHQPNEIHHRLPVIPPKTPPNSSEVFRRGKKYSALKHKIRAKPDIAHRPPFHPSIDTSSEGQFSKFSPLAKPRGRKESGSTDSDARNERARKFEFKERKVIENHASSSGIVETPPGSFDQFDSEFLMNDDFDENMFEEYFLSSDLLNVQRMHNAGFFGDEADTRDAGGKVGREPPITGGLEPPTTGGKVGTDPPMAGNAERNIDFSLGRWGSLLNDHVMGGSEKNKNSESSVLPAVSNDRDVLDVPFDESDEDFFKEWILGND